MEKTTEEIRKVLHSLYIKEKKLKEELQLTQLNLYLIEDTYSIKRTGKKLDELKPIVVKVKSLKFSIKKKPQSQGNNKDFIPFKEAREFARSLKLTKSRYWSEYCQGRMKNLPLNLPPKPDNIPTGVFQEYKDQGWKGMPDFLGYDSNLNSPGITRHRDSGDRQKEPKDETSPEMKALDKKFPKTASSSSGSIPNPANEFLDDKRPLRMEIGEKEKTISDDSIGKLF